MVKTRSQQALKAFLDQNAQDPKVSAYEGDKFYPEVTNFHCLPFKLDFSDNHLKDALAFCQFKFKNNWKNIRSVRNSFKVDNDKDTNRDHLPVDLNEMKNETWFEEIFKQISGILKSINKDLRIYKFQILRSKKGCKQQDFHTDNKPSPNEKNYSVLLSLMPGTSLVLRDQEDSEEFEYELRMKPKSIAVFNDNCMHAGNWYGRTNFRLFFGASNKLVNDVLDPEKDEIHGEKECNFELKRCEFCYNYEAKVKKTTKDKRAAIRKHHYICYKYYMEKNKVKAEVAKKSANAVLEERRKKNKKNNKSWRDSKKA